MIEPWESEALLLNNALRDETAGPQIVDARLYTATGHECAETLGGGVLFLANLLHVSYAHISTNRRAGSGCW